MKYGANDQSSSIMVSDYRRTRNTKACVSQGDITLSRRAYPSQLLLTIIATMIGSSRYPQNIDN